MVKVDGVRQPANFVVTYLDEKSNEMTEGPHCLTLKKYGEGALRDAERWVLLEADA